MPALNTLLCPIDFSECALNALEYATRLANYYQAELHILHVLETGDQGPEAITEQQQAFAEGKLARFKETILAESGIEGLKGCTIQVSSGKISATIMDYADRIEASMLVLGAEG
ncbi:universal stress protein [Nitritalea halalkaliphila]|uniref:universal stress protein n=1 Tax=Nitritalea halalkaliphila TaxID=590849 RepID=UPI0002FE6F3B|nr:universal stress protein [Nitritalea halalkaliphila]